MRTWFRSPLKPVLALAFAAGLLVSAGQAQGAAPAPAWPQATSDIPADPAVRFGVLPNGMRYALTRNATPPGQASIRLRFDAGSLMETDAQQGLAHFLEHMAFNGSRHVKEGEMVKILERHGLDFGADTNASTNWTETVYQLDLPTTDDDTVDTSLMLMRETASELTIDQAAMDRERGVVLSEERSRDTPQYQVFKNGLAFTLRGQLPPRRLPIGQVEVIRNAGRDLMVDFYHHYYRPDRATLVVAGDFDLDAMEAKIKARFGDWTPVGPAGPEPDSGALQPRGEEVKLVVQPGAPLSIQFTWLRPADLRPDSQARRARDTIDQLGLAVLNRRLEKLARSDAPPFINAYAYKTDEFHAAEVTNLAVSAQPDKWRDALAAAEQAERRLLQYGVRQDELDREIAEMRVQLKSAADSAATRKTPNIANDIVDTLYDRNVYTSPAEDLALFEAEAKGLTAATVSDSLKSTFAGGGPLLFMATPRPIEGGEAAVSAAFAQSRAAPVAPLAATEVLTWPYESFGPAGKVAERKEAADLGVTLVRFENGVRLTVKPTRFHASEIQVRVRVGDGLLDLPRDRVTAIWAARGAFVEGGLKRLSSEDLERILASRIYGADFGVEDDAVTLQGRTRPQDLALQMQLLTAYLVEPGFRPQAFLRMRAYGATLLDQFAATPGGVMSRDLGRLLHSGDARFAFPSRAEIEAGAPEDFKAVISHELASGPVEVTVVGDVTVDQAIAEVARTFGALPPRADAAPPADARVSRLPAPTSTPVVLTHKGRADQALAFVEWPATDFYADTQTARTLRVVAKVMELRLLDDLRETSGVTYSPNASATASQTFPGFGYVAVVVETPPSKVDQVFASAARIAGELRSVDVTDDELQRAKKPLLDSLLKAREGNDYWLEQLSGAQTQPGRLDAIRSVVPSIQRVTAADIRAAARTWLKDETMWKLKIAPEAAPAG